MIVRLLFKKAMFYMIKFSSIVLGMLVFMLGFTGCPIPAVSYGGPPSFNINGTVSNSNSEALSNIKIMVTNDISSNIAYSTESGEYTLLYGNVPSWDSNFVMVFHDTNGIYSDYVTDVINPSIIGYANNCSICIYELTIDAVMTNK